MRLLLVEDEEKTSSYINRALSELGFNVYDSVFLHTGLRGGSPSSSSFLLYATDQSSQF